MIATKKQIRAAIKAMDAARASLAPLVRIEDENNSITRLRSDLAEYAGYLEDATWWRTGEKK